VRYRKEAVWVLLGTQYWSQCESKRGDCLGPKEGGIWAHDKGVCDGKEKGSMGPVGNAIWVPV